MDPIATGEGNAPGRRPRLFVVHAPQDRAFVEGFLLAELPLGRDEILVSTALTPGVPYVQELARGALGEVTVLVISPAFLASPLASAAEELAQHAAAVRKDVTVIPAIIADCDLSFVQTLRVPLDFRDQDVSRWKAEVGRLREMLALPAPVPSRPPCPYPGLRAFADNPATPFHGREDEIDDLIGKLRRGRREIYVIGSSGSGKSSLIAAGLVPRLARDPQETGHRYAIRTLRPGSDPAGALAAALGASRDSRNVRGAIAGVFTDGSADRVLVVVDQLEELFSQGGADVAEFIEMVRALREAPRVVLLFVLRADFYGPLIDSELFAAGRMSRLDVPSLRGKALRVAIELPARAVGVHVEQRLLDVIERDAANQPGALPLLQEALVALWRRLAGKLLRLADYQGDGGHSGLARTVMQLGDDALDALPAWHRAIALRLFLRLVQFGEGAPDTRRQESRARLATIAASQEEIDEVIRHLTEHRLLTTSRPDGADEQVRVDLAHEILLSAWPTLQVWIATHREHERERRVLEREAERWSAAGRRGPIGLLDEGRLADLDRWLTADVAEAIGLGEDIEALIAASRAAQHTEANARAADSAALEDERARHRLEIAHHHVARAEPLLLQDRGIEAIPHLVAARELGLDNVPLRTLFRWATEQLPIILRHQDGRSRVAWSPDGARIAITDDEGMRVRLWDARTLERIEPELAHGSIVHAIAWSQDGTLLATAGDDGTAQIWDVRDGRKLGAPIEHGGAMRSIAWNPRAALLATSGQERLELGALFHTVRLWDVNGGREIAGPLVHDKPVVDLAWSPDGRRVATASEDGSAAIWDATTDALTCPRLKHESALHALAWDRGGRRLATATADGTVSIWNAHDGTRVAGPLLHDDIVAQVAWSPDGTRVATSSLGTVRLWDAYSGTQTGPTLEHARSVTSISWSPDGRSLATASSEGCVRLWRVRGGSLPLVHESPTVAMEWAPDGTRVLTGSKDHTARIWDARTGEALTAPLGHHVRVEAVAWSPDGARVVIAGRDGEARIWDARSGVALSPLLRRDDRNVPWIVRPGDVVEAIAFDESTSGAARTPLRPGTCASWDAVTAWSPDGTRIAFATQDGALQIWNVEGGLRLEWSLATDGGFASSLAWSPDSSRLAGADRRGFVRVWDPMTGELAAPPLSHASDYVIAIAWNRDGIRLATADTDHKANIWHIVTGDLIVQVPHDKPIGDLAWSPDGARLATAAAATVTLWNPRSGRPNRPPLEHEGVVYAIAWSPDGRRLAVAGKVTRIWDVAWDEDTIEEWHKVLDRCPYRLNKNGMLITTGSAPPSSGR